MGIVFVYFYLNYLIYLFIFNPVIIASKLREKRKQKNQNGKKSSF